MLHIFEGLSDQQQTDASNRLLGLDPRFTSQVGDVFICRAKYEAAVSLVSKPVAKSKFQTELQFIETCLQPAVNRAWKLICECRRRGLGVGSDFRPFDFSQMCTSAIFGMGYHITRKKKFKPPYSLPPSFVALRGMLERFFDFLYHRSAGVGDTETRSLHPTSPLATDFVNNILCQDADEQLPPSMLGYADIEDSHPITQAKTMGALLPHLTKKPWKSKSGLVVTDRSSWNEIVNAPVTSAIITHHLIS